MESKNCIFCNVIFTPKKNKSKFCSIKCSSESQTKRENLNCTVCWKLYFPKSIRSNKRQNHFCTKECYYEYRKWKIFSDNHIKQWDIPWNKWLKWISCWFPKWKPNLKLRWRNHWNWKWSNKFLRIKISNGIEYKTWRSLVMFRDNFTCKICWVTTWGWNKVTFHVDHIKPFATILKENCITTVESALSCKELFDTNNWRLLCKECHLKTDTYWWRYDPIS